MITAIAAISSTLIVCTIVIACLNLWGNKKYEGKAWLGIGKLFRPFIGG